VHEIWQQKSVEHLISYDHGIDGFMTPPGAHDIHCLCVVTAGFPEAHCFLCQAHRTDEPHVAALHLRACLLCSHPLLDMTRYSMVWIVEKPANIETPVPGAVPCKLAIVCQTF
jgi:hypothetical protein